MVRGERGLCQSVWHWTLVLSAMAPVSFVPTKMRLSPRAAVFLGHLGSGGSHSVKVIKELIGY